jgi:hypothetical protein
MFLHKAFKLPQLMQKQRRSILRCEQFAKLCLRHQRMEHTECHRLNFGIIFKEMSTAQ